MRESRPHNLGNHQTEKIKRDIGAEFNDCKLGAMTGKNLESTATQQINVL